MKFNVVPDVYNSDSFLQMGFPVDELNKFVKDEVWDSFNYYQNRFKIFGSMQLTKLLKFKIHKIAVLPFLWQPHQSCAWSPMQGSYKVDAEITPTAIMLNSEICEDTLLEGIFKGALNWSKNGGGDYPTEDIGVVNEYMKQFMYAAVWGLRSMLFAGQLDSYLTANINISAAMQAQVPNFNTIFNTQLNTQKGLLQGLKEQVLATQCDVQVGGQSVLAADVVTVGTKSKYTGDVIELLTKTLFDSATIEMQNLSSLGIGGAMGSQNSQLVHLLSPSVYLRLTQQYQEESQNPLSNARLISREEVTNNGQKLYVYYVNDIPVIPINEQAVYEQYTDGTLHFAITTFAGNIQMGGSFVELPSVENPIGLMVQRSKDLKDLGKIYQRSHQLAAVSIANINHIVATQHFQ